MDFQTMVEKNRSYRRFDQSRPVGMAVLDDLAGLARIVGSAMNAQPLRYALVADPDMCAKVFACLGWAGMLKDWKGPAEGERPTAYIVVMADPKAGGAPQIDHGIAAQTMLLGAVERGFGGCMIGTVNKKKVAAELSLPEGLDILLVIALGVPVETVVLEDVPASGELRYWRTDDHIHHVPKRSLDDLVVSRYPEPDA